MMTSPAGSACAVGGRASAKRMIKGKATTIDRRTTPVAFIHVLQDTGDSRTGLGAIPVEDADAVPGDDTSTIEDGRERPLDVTHAVRHAREIGVARDRHDLGTL